MVYESWSASVAKPKPPASIAPLALEYVDTTLPSFMEVMV